MLLISWNHPLFLYLFVIADFWALFRMASLKSVYLMFFLSMRCELTLNIWLVWNVGDKTIVGFSHSFILSFLNSLWYFGTNTYNPSTLAVVLVVPLNINFMITAVSSLDVGNIDRVGDSYISPVSSPSKGEL